MLDAILIFWLIAMFFTPLLPIAVGIFIIAFIALLFENHEPKTDSDYCQHEPSRYSYEHGKDLEYTEQDRREKEEHEKWQKGIYRARYQCLNCNKANTDELSRDEAKKIAEMHKLEKLSEVLTCKKCNSNNIKLLSLIQIGGDLNTAVTNNRINQIVKSEG